MPRFYLVLLSILVALPICLAAQEICDNDIDGDTVLNGSDNCAAVANKTKII